MAPLPGYAHLYSTNAVPNPQEAGVVQQEVDTIKSRISTLKIQLRELEEDLRQHEAVLSPVRRIPVEVWGEIFSLALPASLNGRGRKHLVDFCRVCRLWREAALAARWLWSSVIINTDQISHSFEELVSWLTKSGDFSKSIQVSTKNVDRWDLACAKMGSECKLGSAVLAKMLTDGPVLDHLCVVCRDPECFLNLVEAIHYYSAWSKPRTRPWDCLRSLDLHFVAGWNGLNQLGKLVLRHIPSSVTSLTIRILWAYAGLMAGETPHIYISPATLQRLTNVKLIVPILWRIPAMKLLGSCQNAESLSFVTLHVPFAWPTLSGLSPMPTFRLSNLRTLRLALPAPALINTICFFETPNLASLDIHPYSDAEGIADAVISLVSRSKCQNTLRHLHLHNSDLFITEVQLSSLLRGLPFITHLTLDGIPSGIIEGAFRILSATPSIDDPFKLEVLELRALPEPFRLWLITGYIPGTKNQHEGVDFLDEPRAPIFTNLKRVDVTHQPMTFQGSFMDDDVEEAGALKELGVVINVGPWENPST